MRGSEVHRATVLRPRRTHCSARSPSCCTLRDRNTTHTTTVLARALYAGFCVCSARACTRIRRRMCHWDTEPYPRHARCLRGSACCRRQGCWHVSTHARSIQLRRAFNDFDAATLHAHDAQPLRRPSKPCGVGASRAPRFCAHLAHARSQTHTHLPLLQSAYSGSDAAALHEHDTQPLRQTSKPCGVDTLRAPHFYGVATLPVNPCKLACCPVRLASKSRACACGFSSGASS